MFSVQAQDMVARLVNVLRYSFSENETTRFRWRHRARSCVRLTRLVKWRESQSQVQPLLQEHVIVSLVRDCYPHAVAWS
jgi:hypothetical protein